MASIDQPENNENQPPNNDESPHGDLPPHDSSQPTADLRDAQRHTADLQPNRELQASERSWFIPPPHGWRHPVTGRKGWQPDPLLLAFGQYVKRSRYLALMSQTQLAQASGVDQGAISRLERALAPAMNIDRVVQLAAAMGRAFPLGYCPHEHWCQWQRAPDRAPDPPRRLTPEKAHILYGLTPAGDIGVPDEDDQDDENLLGLDPNDFKPRTASSPSSS